jgi:hypothetical protein
MSMLSRVKLRMICDVIKTFLDSDSPMCKFPFLWHFTLNQQPATPNMAISHSLTTFKPGDWSRTR